MIMSNRYLPYQAHLKNSFSNSTTLASDITMRFILLYSAHHFQNVRLWTKVVCTSANSSYNVYPSSKRDFNMKKTKNNELKTILLKTQK